MASTALARSVWVIYGIIVFEILFMISPFAFYYYSAYAMPLNWLAAQPSTAWLVQHILPHFAYHTSTTAKTMLIVAWPIIFLGLVMFIIAFAQIYWAKFTGKGAVSVGLYRSIRHPQYVALAIIGLGTTMYWSRFLILISFIAMLFLYYALSLAEEARCRQHFGADYEDYVSRTGRFLPRSWTDWLPARPVLNLSGGQRIAVCFALWVVVTAVSVAGGFAAKRAVIDRMQTVERPGFVLLALAPVPSLQPWISLIEESSAVRSRLSRAGDGNVIAYLAPATWSIPELGLSPNERYEIPARDELLHPAQHGNSLEFDRRYWRILFTRAEGVAEPGRLLMTSMGITPLFQVEVAEGVITDLIDRPGSSFWSGIPVPIY